MDEGVTEGKQNTLCTSKVYLLNENVMASKVIVQPIGDSPICE